MLQAGTASGSANSFNSYFHVLFPCLILLRSMTLLTKPLYSFPARARAMRSSMGGLTR